MKPLLGQPGAEADRGRRAQRRRDGAGPAATALQQPSCSGSARRRHQRQGDLPGVRHGRREAGRSSSCGSTTRGARTSTRPCADAIVVFNATPARREPEGARDSPARCSSARSRRTALTASSSTRPTTAASARSRCPRARSRCSSSRTDATPRPLPARVAEGPVPSGLRGRPRPRVPACCDPPAAYVGPVTTRETNDMTYRQLGDSGLTVSTVGLGCNNFGRRLDQEGTNAVVDAAIDAGVTLFDTADIYGQRRERGAARAGARARARRRRGGHEVRHGHAGRATDPTGACAGSRRYVRNGGRGEPAPARHRLDRPLPAAPSRPATRRSSETLAALDELVREGKVRYIGCSNLTGWQVVDADWTARAAGTERVRLRAERVLPARARRRGGAGAGLRARRGRPAAVLPARLGPAHRQVPPRRGGAARAPASRGRPSGSAAADWDTIERLEAYAAERGLRLIDVAIGGLAAQPAVASVIAGATRPEQVARQRAGRARGSRPSTTSPPSTRSRSRRPSARRTSRSLDDDGVVAGVAVGRSPTRSTRRLGRPRALAPLGAEGVAVEPRAERC